jgi:hypothetical protein
MIMGIIYRCEKGAPLTKEEVDGNFRELDQRVQALEPQGGRGSDLGVKWVQKEDVVML